MTGHDAAWDDLLAAHALHALDEADQQRLVAHLATCPICRARLQEFEETTAALARAVPASPLPDGFTARLVARAGALRADTLARPAPPSSPALDRPTSHSGQINWWRQRLVPVLAALALAVALASGWQVFRLQQQLATERAQMARLAAILAAQPADFRELRGTGAPQASGRLVVGPNGQVGLLAARDLPPLPPDHVYQLWLVRDGQRTSGGTFTIEDGAGWLLVQAPAPLSHYQAIGVTVEPAPGSPGPTSPQIIGGRL